jgi:hypothetical protein
MEALELTNPMFWVSIVLGGIILAAVSYGFQMYQDENASEPKQLNVKGLIRDTLLGGIFTAMAWTLIPDTMKSLTSSFTTGVSTATAATTSAVSAVTAATTAVTSGSNITGGGSSTDVDIQVGPARF